METTLKKPIIKFKQWTCKLDILRYGNGRIALQLVDHITGEEIATASVNLDEVDIKEEHVAIKDYSENKGMADVLIKAGIIKSAIVKSIHSGFVVIDIYEHNIDLTTNTLKS